MEELSNLSIHVDRYVGIADGFADASSQAYDAALYLHVLSRKSINVTLWCAKSKVVH